jgi:hypothetical protein
MLQLRLGSDDTFLMLAPRWADFGPAAQVGLLALLLLVPLGLIVWLYRYEMRLIAPAPAAGLLTLRMLMFLVIWVAIGLQPRVVGVRVEETPSRVRIAVDLSSSMDIADTEEGNRKSAVAKILSREGRDLLRRIAERHQVEIVGFHQRAVELTPDQLLTQLSAVDAGHSARATDFQQALDKATSSRAEPLLGIVLFSDGQHNVGPPPYARADELGKQGVPIFPVVIGPRTPPSDLLIMDVQAPARAFKNATVPIEVRCKATGMPAQDFTLEMQFAGKPVQAEHRSVVAHDGKDGIFSVRFQAKMEEVGTHALTIKADSSKGKEITLANNNATRIIRVADDKAKVLLVDGEARWEYHYVAQALLRDEAIVLERVVFSQPRIGALKEDQLDKARLPRTKLPEAKPELPDPLLDFDCVVLGDVAPDDLPGPERRRLEKFVAERGGTLIMVAGKRHMPLAYNAADDPLVKMLPITQPRELKLDAGFTWRISGEGMLQPFLQLEPGTDKFNWPDLPKHYWCVVGKPRPAASVLAVPVSDEDVPADGDTGILVHQNYGFGRVLFVGIDSTWRWRYRVGDAYHHRFWGQLARWSAAEKLLPAGNRHIRFGPREPAYSEGQEVELAVRMGESLPPLARPALAQAKLLRKQDDGTEEMVAVVPLAVNPRRPTVLEAKIRDLPAGIYRMSLDIPQYREQLAEPNGDNDGPKKGADVFRIWPRENGELLDLSANWDIMQSLADRSGGKLYTPADVDDLLDRLQRRVERKEYRDESKPWQDTPMVWWMLGILLGLLTLEWGWRKWLDLP